jgi:hypothetical protein
MMLKKITTFLLLATMVSSCVSDKCKTCEFSSYIKIGGQIYNESKVDSVFCGEQLQDLIDAEYSIDTITVEGSSAEIEQTTFITCY